MFRHRVTGRWGKQRCLSGDPCWEPYRWLFTSNIRLWCSSRAL